MTTPLQPSRHDERPATMRAMLLERPGLPLQAVELPVPRPAAGQILLRVEACGVCRTDLPLLDGGLPDPEMESQLHFLKGSALNLGLSDLAALCQEGERLAGQGRGSEADPARIVAIYEASKTAFLGALADGNAA